MVSLVCIGPSWSGVNTIFTEQLWPARTAACCTQEPPVTAKIGSPSLLMSDGTKEPGPWLTTNTSHSCDVSETAIVPKSIEASDSVGSNDVDTTWRPTKGTGRPTSPGSNWWATRESARRTRPFADRCG